MSLDDEITQFEATMERLVGAYRARMVSMCKNADLTPPQFWAMHTIGEAGRLKMSPLADALGLSMGAVSTLVDRLVGRGLVQREADPTDRRAVFVSLTTQGQSVLEDTQCAKRDIAKHAFKHMDPEIRQQLLNGLAAMVEAWERVGPTTKPPSIR